MTLQRHYIRRGKNISFLARRGVILTLLLFTQVLFGIDYYEYDFRDRNNTYHARASFNPKSNKLQLNIFDNKWSVLPTHTQNNCAYGGVYYDFYYNYESYKIGIFRQEEALIYLNDGFIQTLYQSNNDFNTFLHKNNLNTQITDTKIEGYINYYKLKGMYLQKVFQLNKEQALSAKLKLFIADDGQEANINGHNTQQRFVANLNYYYRAKNYISKRTSSYTTSDGYGYSLDLEYIYNKEALYIYAGLLNIGGIIYWDGISQMYYNFDSQTVYLGDDGYNHRKAFGIGYYKDGVKHQQHLPIFYRASIDYQFLNFFSLGNNISGYKDVIFNEPYVTIKLYNSRYKVGYMYEGKTAIFAAYFKYFKVEISNNFSFSQQIMQAKVHIWF